MAAAIGLDIQAVEQMERALARRPVRLKQRLFTAAEQADCERRARPAVHYSGRFAAKEAFLKALDRPTREGITWREIEVFRAGGGRPRYRLAGHARAALAAVLPPGTVRPEAYLRLSISHSGGYAAAVCLLAAAPAADGHADPA